MKVIKAKYKLVLKKKDGEEVLWKGTKIKKKWRESLSNSQIEDEVVSEIYKTFVVGNRYTKSDIKDALNNLYERKGYQKKAKATDLELYYLMKYVKFQDSVTNKWVNGFELIGKR